MQAAGLIIYRHTAAAVEFLVLQTSYGKHHWTPPKGFIDGEEDSLTAAIRETQEEAGYGKDDYIIQKDFRRVLTYFDPTKKKDKFVHYWLAKLKNPDNPVKLSKEHQAFRWVDAAEACRLVEHKDIGAMLKEANAFVLSLPTSL